MALAYAPGAVADENVAIAGVEIIDPTGQPLGTAKPGFNVVVRTTLVNHQLPEKHLSCIEISSPGLFFGKPKTCIPLNKVAYPTKNETLVQVKEGAANGPHTITVNLTPGKPDGVGTDTKTATLTVTDGAAVPPGNPPPVPPGTTECDPVTIEAQGYRNGRTKGLEDGRKDGFADAYKQSYDDASKSRQGLTADECKALEGKGYTAGYTKGYETGFEEGKAKGGKAGQKEGKEDRRKGTSQNVAITNMVLNAEGVVGGELDCAQGLKVTARLTGSAAGTVRYHWEGQKASGTVTFAAPQEAQQVTHTVVVPNPPPGPVTAAIVIDSGPSKGQSKSLDVPVTCKK
ncbi:hypothetical protein DEJ50_21840 [Streptomyces venezuelae]|uniref:Uncharacterized protein n=2 Tax=Streptomyces venezuelae TaxID=54571 RepID=A0A5P2D4J0_STRVZ|nr:hypothetical protein DEJ50_21840 [Streptomyces venezuelae]